MLEHLIEEKLCKAVKKHNGLALKFVSPGFVGVPDRILLFPNGILSFVELKAPGKKPRPLQFKRIEQLRKLGFKVFVLDHPDQIELVIKEILDV
ncbi:MAG: VRR-NUC domain-containing protein [Clostridia bacterium]